ncbi:fructosamine kinase family protein [Pseudomaricurvus sp.]|uniref:fructosamine kinase family protein n=1 Tax=Pseudomaricurvus sp. TaxID=2004510 RepID=UPI003F6D93E6
MLQPTLDDINHLVEHALSKAPAGPSQIWPITTASPVSGGDTHECYLLQSTANNKPGARYFLKLNQLARQPLFTAESEGLQAICHHHQQFAGCIASCRVLHSGHFQAFSYLLLEALDLQAEGDWFLAGQQLARLHQAPAGNRFGFECPSYCGNSYQPNTWEENWSQFFARHRIGHQLTLLWKSPLDSSPIQRIVQTVEEQLHNRQPRPALVHGDLWRGNIGFHRQQQGDSIPVIFDPACYYGDPETDLAMSEFFGRFPEDFYRGYSNVRPIDKDYSVRRPLYQLYHLLNHANLFGGSYRQQAELQLQTLS